MRKYTFWKDCPQCGNQIPKKSEQCKYCKIYIRKYEQKLEKERMKNVSKYECR